MNLSEMASVLSEPKINFVLTVRKEISEARKSMRCGQISLKDFKEMSKIGGKIFHTVAMQLAYRNHYNAKLKK